MKRLLMTMCAAALLAAAGAVRAADDDEASNAVLQLLNSRAAGSPRAYAEAAKEVAVQAKAGKAVYAFVLALVSRERDAPEAARLDDKTRQEYLDKFRGPLQRVANERNNPMALYLLSLEHNDTNLLHRAAVAGNVQAENAWGSLVFTQAIARGGPSNVVEKALGEAHGFFKSAAGKGDANGLYNLGMCLWRGLGTPRDEVQAFNCFRTAAEKGHAEAINNIGAFFRKGIVVEPDATLAAKWFAKSASYGNSFGEFNYALALKRGEGVKKDDAAAVTMLERAAKGDCVEAIDALGVALWKGEGAKADANRAFALFRKAADAGYPPAMENLATCYEQGTGVQADERLAMEWKIRSRAARGDRNAQAWLRQNAMRKE